MICKPICQALIAIDFYKEQMMASHLRNKDNATGQQYSKLGLNADHYYINEPELRKILRTHIANDIFEE